MIGKIRNLIYFLHRPIVCFSKFSMGSEIFGALSSIAKHSLLTFFLAFWTSKVRWSEEASYVRTQCCNLTWFHLVITKVQLYYANRSKEKIKIRVAVLDWGHSRFDPNLLKLLIGLGLNWLSWFFGKSRTAFMIFIQFLGKDNLFYCLVNTCGLLFSC